MRMYVVRVMDEAADDTLRGIVQRVADGSERPFHGGEQLVEFLSERDLTPRRDGS